MGSIAEESPLAGSKMSKAFQQRAAEFRRHLPDLSIPRFQVAKTQSCYEYVDAFRQNKQPPWIYNLTEAWAKLIAEPYKGVTTDGTVIPDLYHVQDEGVPMEKIIQAVENVLSKLDARDQDKVRHPMNAHEWRAWSNPEFLLRPFGVRMEEISEDAAQAILAVLKATFSEEGYRKALGAMRVNHFLGELVELPRIMNKYSYNFLVFGTPSTTEAWGWTLYGHHLCLNVFLKGRQIFITPTFTGAEPNVIDDGPFAGTAILHPEGDYGLQFMQSLTSEQQKTAQIYKLMRDPAMLQTGDLTVDRWNKDDQRHVCGASRDNRIVPYEGLNIADLSVAQHDLIIDIAEQFLLYLPDTARAAKKQLIKSHFRDTWFCWIGSWGDEDPFYFRIQSPVIVLEFDHHSGVFLDNQEPGKFHTHTIVRMPNQGDYGSALRKPDERLS